MSNWQVVSIYVAVASYRDRYLQSTIDSAMSTADNPSNITFGCFVQLSEADLVTGVGKITNNYGGRVSYIETIAGNIFSVTECRNQALSWLLESHDFVLQVDSHTKFTPGWDTQLVTWHADLPDKSLFSTYLPGWITNNDSSIELFPDYDTGCQFPTFNDEIAKGYFMRTYDLVPNLTYVSKQSHEFKKTWYLCGHFIFGPAQYFREITQPSWIVFWGEELYHSLIAAGHGWSVYAPPARLLRHLYPQDILDNPLPKLWVDFSEKWIQLHDESTDKVIDAIVNRTVGKDYLPSIDFIDDLYEYLGYDLGELLDGWRRERKALH